MTLSSPSRNQVNRLVRSNVPVRILAVRWRKIKYRGWRVGGRPTATEQDTSYMGKTLGLWV